MSIQKIFALVFLLPLGLAGFISLLAFLSKTALIVFCLVFILAILLFVLPAQNQIEANREAGRQREAALKHGEPD